MANCTKNALQKLLELVILPKIGRWHSSAHGQFVNRQNAQKMIPLSAERNHCIIIHAGVYRDFCRELEILESVIPHKGETLHFPECGAGQVLHMVAHVLFILGCGFQLGNVKQFDVGILGIILFAEPCADAIFSRADFQVSQIADLQ